MTIFEKIIYIGPYIEIVIKNCSTRIDTCERHANQIPENANYCPICGRETSSRYYFEPYFIPSIPLNLRILTNDIFRSHKFNILIIVPNGGHENQFGKLFSNDAYNIDISNVDMNEEIKWFKDFFKKDINDTIKIFKNIFIEMKYCWGMVSN